MSGPLAAGPCERALEGLRAAIELTCDLPEQWPRLFMPLVIGACVALVLAGVPEWCLLVAAGVWFALFTLAMSGVLNGAIERLRRRREPIDEWIVRRDGRDVATLVEPYWVDMFWVEWRIVPHDGVDLALLGPEKNGSPWVFRHAISGRVAGGAYTAGAPATLVASHVLMRGLY